MECLVYQKKELFVFEGFTNRVNALASALLRWEDGFLIRWMENQHCPVAFGELFEGFPGVAVSSDSGGWQEYHYENNGERLCHYFLSTKRERRAVKRAYELILQHCRIGGYEDELAEAGNSVAFHYRKHIEWAKAPESVCLDLLAVLCDRTAASQVLLASDDDETAVRLAEKIQAMGFPVKLLGHGAGLMSDFDRDKARVLEFVRVWRTITECRWAISNAISSTVLDASRALGNEVWTFGDLAARNDHGCAFFNRFGFDWLVAGSALEVSGKEERKIMKDFSEDYGKRLISYCLFGEDQEFLEECVWRSNQAEAFVHDSHGSFDGRMRPFPEPRNGKRFVGERVASNGEPLTNEHELIEGQGDRSD